MSGNVVHVSHEFIYKNVNKALFNEVQLKQLSFCKTVDHCDTYLGRPEVANDPVFAAAIKQIKLRLKSKTFECFDDFDRECLVCLLNYEEVRSGATKSTYTAKRTRQSGVKSGWKQMIVNFVSKRNAENAKGFQILKSFNCLEASFEYFVVQNSQEFPAEVVSLARDRLMNAGLKI